MKYDGVTRLDESKPDVLLGVMWSIWVIDSDVYDR